MSGSKHLGVAIATIGLVLGGSGVALAHSGPNDHAPNQAQRQAQKQAQTRYKVGS